MFFHIPLLYFGNTRFQSPENLLSFVIGDLGVDHGVLDVCVSEVVSDELYAFASIEQMGGYGVSQGMDGVFRVNACFLSILFEQLLHPLPAEIALSPGENGISCIKSLLEILPDELFRCFEEWSFSADPALHSVDEYPFILKVNVG